MSEIRQSVIFEHPLNERTRSWLRIETSLQQMSTLSPLDSLPSSLAFFRAVAAEEPVPAWFDRDFKGNPPHIPSTLRWQEAHSA